MGDGVEEFELHKRRFISNALREDINGGYECVFERDFLTMIQSHPTETTRWVGSGLGEYSNNARILTAILYSVSHFPPTDTSQLKSFVYECLDHDSVEVQEGAIGVIEHWRSRDCLNALLKFRTDVSWLQDYTNQIIGELEGELQAY